MFLKVPLYAMVRNISGSILLLLGLKYAIHESTRSNSCDLQIAILIRHYKVDLASRCGWC